MRIRSAYFVRLSFTECMGSDEMGYHAWVEERKGVILKAGIDDAWEGIR